MGWNLIYEKILLVLLFTILIPNVYAITEISNQYGSLSVEQEIYEITKNFQTNIKIYGSATDYTKEDRINITITNPDGLTEGLHLIGTKDGYFETYWIAVDDTIRGEYTILASYAGQIIGEVQFTIQDRVYTQEELDEARGTSTPVKTSSSDEVSESLTQDETLEEPKPQILVTKSTSSNEVSIPIGTSSPGCEVQNKCFTPSTISISPGTTVTWSNDDTAAHTVTGGSPSAGPSGEFDSSLFMAGNIFSHKFESTGTFNYFCMVHPWMIGKVIVGTSQTTPQLTTEIQTATLTIKTTKNTELESTNSIYQKISNVLRNADYSLDEKTIFPFEDGTIKTSYTIIGPDGETFGGVNMWSNDNYVKRLEIATSHFNDFESTAIATIALAGMIKGVMDSNEYDVELFAEMFGEAASDSNYETDSIRITPSGHKVTVGYITIVEGVPGLTIVTFNIDYKQDITTKSLEVSQNSPSNVVTPSVETVPLEKNENQEPSTDNSETNSGNAALGALVVFGIPAIIIGLVIFRRQRRKKLLEKLRDKESKGDLSVASNTRPKANKESKDEMKWEGI